MHIRHLRQGERHVSQSGRHIAEQEARIVKLRSDGHNIADAENLLQLFRDMQAMHVSHRDRILKELER